MPQQTQQSAQKTPDQIKEEFAKRKIYTANSYLDHKTIASLVFSGASAKEKIDLLNSRLPEDKQINSLKGFNKEKMIEVVKDLTSVRTELNQGKTYPQYDGPGDNFIIEFKKAAEELRMNNIDKQVERELKGPYKFKESSQTPEEYRNFIIENKDSIINAKGNVDKISPALFMLAYDQNKDALLNNLISAAVSPDLLQKFNKEPNLFVHNEQTNFVKKAIINHLNSNPEHVQNFKKSLGLEPTINLSNNNTQQQQQQNQIKR